ncbi:MAG: beta-ketoacyl synthase [Bacteroidales bacterium]|nr:beta-ketoacyl synthase [Bacteroidales bacterium]
MIVPIAQGIVSPIGLNCAETWLALSHGESALALHEGTWNLSEPFFGSLFVDEKIEAAFADLLKNSSFSPISNARYTKFEKIAILSIAEALSKCEVNPASNEVCFVISTTKGNVELLDNPQPFEPERVYLWRSAQLIAHFFKNPIEPIVVSNACISGCVAQVVAERLLTAKRYRYVVVVGADVLSKFVVSGFQSFKSLSLELCRPFDKDRTGLNLGEAAATLIYAKSTDEQAKYAKIALVASAICNDANHISAPSRTAEGQFAVLQKIKEQAENIFSNVAFVNAHGTATRYNDDMESVALERAALNSLPINSLKGYFGHTLGAAGLLETIISQYELQNKMLLKCRGTQQLGTVAPIQVITENRELTDNKGFIKMISGFGGSNAALLFANKEGECDE